MTFNTFNFMFIFLPITLILFFTFAKYSHNLAKILLLCASILFYSSINLKYLPLLIISILINYFISIRLISRRLLLITGISLNFLLLIYCKITGFLPLGISFYTFTQTSYLFDVYLGKNKNSCFIDYVNYVLFFGCIASGPIAKINEAKPEFSIDYEKLSLGITLFFLGLFKKVFIADRLSGVVNQLFAASNVITFTEAWLAVFAYSVQLYFDFSGYSDMAISIGI